MAYNFAKKMARKTTMPGKPEMKPGMTMRKNHIHQSNLGHSKSDGKSFGQKMLYAHKGMDMSSMASRKHESRQMRKHGISLSHC